ncbi:MAG TPA: SDR family oxidoreductase [Phototrophicaceae bacterium]|nr:SDR family oxidoreductase [Phototrophicaceae bacterium]
MAHIDLNGQIAIVTGSAHRVGRAIALELAKSGVGILVHYFRSSDETVRDTLHAIRSHGVAAFPVQADLTSAEGVERVFQAARDHFGRLDLLVNSASNFQKRRLLDVSLDEWNETISANLTAPFLCTQQAIRLMREKTPPGGVIVNIGDRGALDPWPDYAHHGISKAGLLALTKVTAASYGPDIRANFIIPGLVMRSEGMSEAYWQSAAQKFPINHPGSAEDVGRAVVYLASEDFLTGVVLNVDGGAGVI